MRLWFLCCARQVQVCFKKFTWNQIKVAGEFRLPFCWPLYWSQRLSSFVDGNRIPNIVRLIRPPYLLTRGIRREFSKCFISFAWQSLSSSCDPPSAMTFYCFYNREFGECIHDSQDCLLRFILFRNSSKLFKCMVRNGIRCCPLRDLFNGHLIASRTTQRMLSLSLRNSLSLWMVSLIS